MKKEKSLTRRKGEPYPLEIRLAAIGESPKDKVHPCDESMTSLFSSLLTFMKSTYFRTRHTFLFI